MLCSMSAVEVMPGDASFLIASVGSHPSPATPRSGKMLKPPKPPEKPLMPYMRYSRKVWDSVKAAHPERKLWEIGKIIGQMWRELSTFEKQSYMEEYEVEKVGHVEAMRSYHNSSAYQQYLTMRDKCNTEEKDGKVKTPSKADLRTAVPSHDPSDSLDDLDYFSLRQLAASRFYRNHRLLHEIFNELGVPDLRQVITIPRLQSLKRQVDALTMHQKKIDGEIDHFVQVFETKKRRLEDSTRDFHLLLEKCNTTPVDKVSYNTMIESAERQLLSRYDEYVERMQAFKAAEDATNKSPPSSETTSKDSPERAETETIDIQCLPIVELKGFTEVKSITRSPVELGCLNEEYKENEIVIDNTAIVQNTIKLESSELAPMTETHRNSECSVMECESG